VGTLTLWRMNVFFDRIDETTFSRQSYRTIDHEKGKANKPLLGVFLALFGRWRSRTAEHNHAG